MFMFFGNKYIGLDVADSSIEVAMLKKSFGQTKVASLGRQELKSGIVSNGRILDKEKLSVAVKKAFSSAVPKPISGSEVYFGLPESQTFLHHIHLLQHDKKDRSELILKDLQENVPIDKNNLIFSARILKETNEETEILVAASSKVVVKEWSDFLQSIGLRVKNFDVEILASYRDLFEERPKDPVAVVDFGAATVYVGIFDNLGLRQEFEIARAGDHITKQISESLEIDLYKAEVEKIKNGLKGRNKDVVEIVEKELKMIVGGLKDGFAEYQENSHKKISQVVLVGGSSFIIGIESFFLKELNIPTQIGRSKTKDNSPSIFFVEAIGLAMRGAQEKWEATDPNILNY